MLFRSEVEIVSHERDVLVKKLIETEMDAKSTSHMVLKLKETVNKLKKVSQTMITVKDSTANKELYRRGTFKNRSPLRQWDTWGLVAFTMYTSKTLGTLMYVPNVTFKDVTVV